jgi:hypothetical protein
VASARVSAKEGPPLPEAPAQRRLGHGEGDASGDEPAGLLRTYHRPQYLLTIEVRAFDETSGSDLRVTRKLRVSSSNEALLIAGAGENHALAVENNGGPFRPQPLSAHDADEVVGKLAQMEDVADFAIPQDGNVDVEHRLLGDEAHEQIGDVRLFAGDHPLRSFWIARKFWLRSWLCKNSYIGKM